MNVSLGLDTTVWTNTEQVTLTDAATAQSVTVAGVLRRAPQMMERAASHGVYVAALLNWVLPDAGLSGFIPEPADILTDSSGTSWTILDVSRIGVQTTWKLSTIDLTLAFGLYDTATVFRATNTQDAGGGRVPSYTAVYIGVPARFQEIQATEDQERGKRFTRRSFLVYVLNPLDVLIEDNVKDSAGNTYEVRGFHNPQRLDELQVLDCELLPEGKVT